MWWKTVVDVKFGMGKLSPRNHNRNTKRIRNRFQSICIKYTAHSIGMKNSYRVDLYTITSGLINSEGQKEIRFKDPLRKKKNWNSWKFKCAAANLISRTGTKSWIYKDGNKWIRRAKIGQTLSSKCHMQITERAPGGPYMVGMLHRQPRGGMSFKFNLRARWHFIMECLLSILPTPWAFNFSKVSQNSVFQNTHAQILSHNTHTDVHAHTHTHTHTHTNTNTHTHCLGVFTWHFLTSHLTKQAWSGLHLSTMLLTVVSWVQNYALVAGFFVFLAKSN